MYVSGGLIPLYRIKESSFTQYDMGIYISIHAESFFLLLWASIFLLQFNSLVESAKLDGASEFKIFMRIVRPVSTPFIATLALFSAVNQWNAWLDSTYYVSDESLRTIAYRMLTEINQSVGQAVSGGTIVTKSTALTTQSSAMVLSMPIMLVYPFLQKYFVKGIMIGAVKE